MKVAVLKREGCESAHLLEDGRLYSIAALSSKLGNNWSAELFQLLETGAWFELLDWYRTGGAKTLASSGIDSVPIEQATFAPLYRHPRKIWGIGLNYREHAADLDEKSPTLEPGSFMKPDTAIIGPGDEILLPEMSEKTTGEAELGLVFGRRCRNVSKENWQEALAGYTTVIDMTAEDILRRNPRNLTQCKSFDTFFSFGPFLQSLDETPDVMNLRVTTIHNGKEHATNVVSNMTFPPDYLVSYHSRIMTMLPGDILSTGTPGAAHLSHGDTVECHIEGFIPLKNSVRDLKVRP